MRSTRLSIYISLLRSRQLPAMYSNVRNRTEESGGRQHEIRAPPLLQFKVFKEADLKEDEDESRIYSSTDFGDYRGMQLVFLGTSSAVPAIDRNTSCVAARLEGTVYLFDCGEGAQKRLLQTPFRQRRVDKIFITHMHGDHIFGLPGLMIGMSLTGSRWKRPIEIYGPEGLRNWLRFTLISSYGRVPTKYVVHELILKRGRKTKGLTKAKKNEVQHKDELPGRDIYYSGDGLWDVFSDDKYRVRAARLKHSIPCWGYVLEEHPRQGRFIVERAEAIGIEPGENRALLQQGQTIFLNGKRVNPSDVLGPPRRGRKVVILGDTYDSRSLQSIAYGADMIIHECTLPEEDASEAFEKTHSTATMAGKFARSINARSLILTHFGGKFSARKERVVDSVYAAKRAFGKDLVLAAKDLLAVTIRHTDETLDQV